MIIQDAYFLFFSFLFGTAIGSFLNVLALRHGSGITMGGRSRCFSCGKTLNWYELVPVCSFLIQRGRCSKCGSKISWQYPAVELASGIIFLAVSYRVLGCGEGGERTLSVLANSGALPLLALLYYWTVFSVLLAITVYDLKHKIIPDSFVYTFIVLALFNTLGFLDSALGNDSLYAIRYTLYALLAGPFLALPFATLWFISKGRWMGFGDAKLALGIGWFLGLSSGISAIVFSFWIGAFVGIFLLATQRFAPLLARWLFFAPRGITIKSEIPFGPFLALGTLLVFFFNLRLESLLLGI